MPTTRKKVIKTVYKDEGEEETGDYSDSGSEANITEASESSDEQEGSGSIASSEEEFSGNSKRQVKTKKKTKFAKSFIKKITKQSTIDDNENADITSTLFTVKDLTDADKLLPSILNLSESDSSDDENINKTQTVPPVKVTPIPTGISSDEEDKTEYKDVWSQNIPDDSEEIAKRTFMELEQHKATIEETKASLQNYKSSFQCENKESNVTDLLALGEEILPIKSPIKKKSKAKKIKEDSESEVEDWEEVKESKTIPQQGLQLFVEFPDAGRKKTKAIDVEMMMKRKINRVKKEYQIYMHKVHVLCWLGHGNYISRILNDQELMAATLSLIPAKECYPGERVDMKYVEQITTWFKDKLNLKQDKNEDKFRPKAPPLKEILLEQIHKKVVTTKKYLVFIFVVMLRALGLQCRIMFNFVTLPIKPPSTELCSLSIKKDSNNSENKSNLSTITEETSKSKSKKGRCSKKIDTKPKLAQVDGSHDCYMTSDTDWSEIMQLDGNDDLPSKSRILRNTKVKKLLPTDIDNSEDVSPSKIPKKGLTNATYNKKNIESVQKNVKAKTLSLRKESLNTDKTVDINNLRKLQKIESHDTVHTCKSMRSTRSNKLKPALISSNEEVSLSEISKNSTSKEKQNKKPGEKQPQTRRVAQSKFATVKEDKPSNSKTAQVNKSSIDALGNKSKVKPEVTSNTQENNIKTHKPQIIVTNENEGIVSSKFFDGAISSNTVTTRKRSQSSKLQDDQVKNPSRKQAKTRTRSAPGTEEDKSKYFDNNQSKVKRPKLNTKSVKVEDSEEDNNRVSHRDLVKRTSKPKPQSDITNDLMNIIKNRIKDAKVESKKGIVKGKVIESDDDSDYLPEEAPKRKYESDEDFKPQTIVAKPSTSKKRDRRVLSSDDEKPNNKVDVWCEVFVEELEQWACVDIFKAKVHAKDDIYKHATQPVCYIVGWDNNNYLKDLTRRYVPHWNTVTRKQRVETLWWDKAIKPWLGPKTARDREEDECLDRMQLEAPLPKSIAEYKNHPLYALKRHLLKFEAIYPPDAATLGFVRGEAVYARDCVYVCRSRDTWLKEAKVVRLGEAPYKIVKARPKWDKLSNKVITDKPLEVFGPWQVKDYEPPVAENGIVPRNAYGNVEMFKECMLPKGTVHIKLPGLNKVARKLNIDCAPAMTGFDFNGGWTHPVFDGFVVCKEFEEIITEAWLKDQEEQERKEREKTEARVYGNWRKLIKGLLIRERLKNKYGFEEPSTSRADKVRSKGPKLVVKKR
ncbi:hypothetical protein K1T71_005058 [Dendrolimus kikuchii]|uniref:Uncharacterized protein n=1 Tax=Dendrolimus kikuchii TaxID=765133 RepID=A0ACC1D6A2_9NEOP|nr:hypothetical protein K1T71_005058 [Dendrolimus kikuchii]